MGNQESSNVEHLPNHLVFDFENSAMTYLYQIENANLIKCQSQNDSRSESSLSKKQKNSSPVFFLEKMFLSDSQKEYKLLSKYLEKQSLFNIQSSSSEIIKIVKIYQESEKGICSNRYLIKALFEYSDITMQDELKIRASNRQTKTTVKGSQKNYFGYQDLCSIMFACISAFYAVEKMRISFKNFVEKNLIAENQSFRHLEQFLNQFRYNIPLNLDRIIVMPDGTIKVIHPLLIDHQNRIHHSNKFFYSPEKMKDFVLEDGLKGRIFETGLVVLQCALLENTQQMSKVYNGYCVNEAILKRKIEGVFQIYSKMEQMPIEDMKLFHMISKMTQIDPQKRIGLDECIKYAQNLFQLNKKLKESMHSNQSQREIINEPESRMRVDDLESIPYHRIAMKVSPLQNSTQQSTTVKPKDDEKTTARINSYHQTATKNLKQNPQIQVSHFNSNEKIKLRQKPENNPKRNPLESLFISNNEQEQIFTHDQFKCMESLIGKGSDLYSTQKYNFLQSKFEYQKFYFNQLKNSQINERVESSTSSCKKYGNSSSGKEHKYKRLLEQSAKNSSDKKSRKDVNSFIRQKLLRESQKQKFDKSLITTSKFMDIDHIYSKYNFISKANDRQNFPKNPNESNSFVSIKNNQTLLRTQTDYNVSVNDVPFTFSLENSVKGSENKSEKMKMNETNKSEVLEKITPEHIYQKLKKNRMLR